MSEAIGMIETKGYTASVEATDAMAKAANVTISRTIPIGGAGPFLGALSVSVSLWKSLPSGCSRRRQN